MRCPICLAEGRVSDTRVKVTRQDPSSLTITRRRECKEHSGHVTETVEQPSALPLHAILVAGRRDDGRELVTFSVPRLRNDISLGVLKQLAPGELSTIVDDVCRELQTRLPELLTELTADEREKYHEAVGKIADVEVRTLVERRLRSASDEVAHVRYALSFRGRIDTGHGQGFHQAEDFLTWAHEEYGLAGIAPERSGMRALQTAWPGAVAIQPSKVIKRSTKERDFDREKFQESIRKALVGRRSPRRTAELVTAHVLGELVGQESVLTSQLAAAVMDSLRRVDDIAFLRYASIAKRFTTVQDFLREAEGLVRFPSPELVFDRTLGASVARPRPTPESAVRVAGDVETPTTTGRPPATR